jgi:LacI family transcriptional regulator
MKKNRVTIHDIAQILNVSPSTVSRSLNGNPRISIATRKAVEDLAMKHNYRPNMIASYLRKGKFKTAGVIVPRINRAFFSSVIGGIEEVLATAGYSLTICQSNELYDKEVINIKTLMSLQVDGIIMSLATETTDIKYIKELCNTGIKLVMFDRIVEGSDINCVKIDDFNGAYQAVCHLIEQGYREIAHFSGPQHINVYRDRKAGYIKALQDNNLPVRKHYILDDILTKEKGINAFNHLISLKNCPDAIFAASDFSAIGALITAKNKGICIPEELGIVGFANEPFTEYVTPSLTSVDQQSNEMGRTVAHVFLNAKEQSEKINLQPKLIIRKSSNRKQEV